MHNYNITEEEREFLSLLEHLEYVARQIVKSLVKEPGQVAHATFYKKYHSKYWQFDNKQAWAAVEQSARMSGPLWEACIEYSKKYKFGASFAYKTAFLDSMKIMNIIEEMQK